MKRIFLTFALLFSFAIATTSFTSCREQKSVSDKVEDAADDVEDAIEDAADDVEDAVE